MFQSLKQGNNIYILDNADVPTLKIGQVVNVGTPTPVFNPQNQNVMLGFQQKYEISLRAKVDGKEGDFAHLPADQSSHNYGTMIVTDSREAMLSEVDAINSSAQQRINNREKDEATIKACSEIFKSLNPSYAKEAERDEVIGNLSDRLNGIEDAVSQILKALK